MQHLCVMRLCSFFSLSDYCLSVCPFHLSVCLSVCRLSSLQYDLGQQIRVDFEKAFSVKGAPVSDLMHSFSRGFQYQASKDVEGGTLQSCGDSGLHRMLLFAGGGQG